MSILVGRRPAATVAVGCRGLASLVTRAYVHNIYLTFNVIVNLLALVRGVYICLVACLLPPGSLSADAPETQLTRYGADGAGAYNPVRRQQRALPEAP